MLVSEKIVCFKNGFVWYLFETLLEGQTFMSDSTWRNDNDRFKLNVNLSDACVFFSFHVEIICMYDLANLK